MSTSLNTKGAVLRILCLHGYWQNGRTFREKTGGFRKHVKKYTDLVFITAPNVVPPLDGDSNPDDGDTANDLRGWWTRDPNNPDSCEGYQESLQFIEKEFLENGPFDGVLGFSMGATMVGLLCSLAELKRLNIEFKFAILVAGAKSRYEQHQCLYEHTVQMPTLHIFGEKDQVILKERSEDMLQNFHEPTVLTHGGGHFLPASGPPKKIYVDFLQRMLERKMNQ